MVPFFLAHIVFWAALLVGSADLGFRAFAVYVVLWAIGYVGSWWLPSGAYLFVSYIALLDVILVLHVFKGDLPLR